MQRALLDRIWVRFGLYIAGTLLATMALLAGSVAVFSEVQYRGFYRSLPLSVQHELDELQDKDQEDSPKALTIYSQYWQGDLLFGEKLSLMVGLLVCLPFGLAAGFLVSRAITQPLESMAEAATRVATGDFTVRATPARYRGEMSEMVDHFNQMTDALERMAREQRANAAAISHELRTPLTILQARLHAVCDGVINADPGEMRRLLEQAEHLGRLVDDLHTLSMADAGQISFESTRLDLVAFVQEVLSGHARRIAEGGLQLELEIPPSDGAATIEIDPDRMRQILVNLVENALRHARSGGWLGVNVAVDDGEALLSVSDLGPGLDASLLHQPFRRFVHGPMQARGSGLGLSIVHALVVRQGGTVEVSNRPEGGACFQIRFPLAEPLRPSST